MPESRTYTVERTQRVKVRANTIADAERLGVSALNGEESPEGGPIFGHVHGDRVNGRLDPESVTTELTTRRIS